MTGHGFGRGNIQLVGILAKDILDGLDFGKIPEGGGGTVNIDLVDICGPQTAVSQCVFHDQGRTQAFGVRGCDMVGIGG